MTEHDRIRETYRSYAETGRVAIWDPTNPGYARLTRERDEVLVRAIAESLGAEGGRVLDVGCGEGELAVPIAERVGNAEYVGMDLREDAIELARQLAPKAEFHVGVADSMPFEDDSFDVAVCRNVFSSMTSAQMEVASADEIGRVLRPGGWLVWCDIRYPNPSNPAVHPLGEARLGDLFPGWTRELRTMTVLPPIARRLGRFTDALYPLLHAIPPLRSHLVGRLQCPM
jgi:ubiquinone/menaquinone biosynthesis C-methylase UbiE